MDGNRFGGHDCRNVIARLEPQQALTHAIERPEQVGAGRAGVEQQLEVFFQGHFPVVAFGQALTHRHGQAIGGTDTNGRRTAHHHRANGLGHFGDIGAGLPGLFERQNALIEQVQDAITPIDGFHLLCCQQLIAHASPHHSDIKSVRL
ncbi:hypothetical protein D3C75_975900 [compost metagenome]